ncbi:LOW QUALITY PROTEIN: hypothetical protein U9M48_018818 [Paspalum notatum var. saurae]|uniref:Reverse transcriptase domain-containing protein n=1 Tax=Paspalum notatum var. saurae TaxID=547442 RepID=A0AAQ3TA72_PASNO
MKQLDLVEANETKKEAISGRMVLSMLGSNFDQFIVLPVDRTRGEMKRKNFMAKLKVSDQIIVGQEEKEEAVWDFYSNLLGVAAEHNYTLNLQIFLQGSRDLSALDAFFSEDKVWAAIKSLPADKALGPDGYTGVFYKSCRPIIKGDTLAALIKSAGDISKLHLLNSAYITLLPKTADAFKVKDYRPISLVHSFAKLVTKILANCLAPHLKELSAFVKGRCILDNFILVQQTAKVLYREKEHRVLLKLDISKAFDSVSWAFLLQVLRHRGFGPVWCSILSKLLVSSTTRILVNGVPGEPIQHHRGLCQGDPLSPMLFIIIMDVLNALINRASDSGLLQPILTSGPTQRVSLYVYDVVLFLRPCTEDLVLTKEILEVFGDALGLVTNISECTMTPIHCLEQDISDVQASLGCKVQDFPCRYLGLPLSVKKLPKAEFYAIVDKIVDMLLGWKATMLHPAGGMTLVQSVLMAIRIYQLMALDLPKWGRKEINGGHYLVAWGRVQRPLHLGGLGILDLATMGWALKMRWLWLKKTQLDRLWASIDIHVTPQFHGHVSHLNFFRGGRWQHNTFLE